MPIEGDPTQIHQVLLNLAVNARDAMPQGGTLRFEAGNVKLDEERSFLNLAIPPGPYIRISVIDTGSGMSPEVQARVFEPFYTTKAQGKGTGLGLSTVLGIIKGHNGLIEIESKPGSGSTFTIHLPALAAGPVDSKAGARADLPRGSGECILVVDDESHILRMTSIALKNHGYQTETAPDGATAVAMFASARDRYALVITDVMMPYMDGVALTRSLKMLDPTIPIIVVSGMMDEDPGQNRTEELTKLGVKTVLQKPFAIADLIEAIHEQIRR